MNNAIANKAVFNDDVFIVIGLIWLIMLMIFSFMAQRYDHIVSKTKKKSSQKVHKFIFPLFHRLFFVCCFI